MFGCFFYLTVRTFYCLVLGIRMYLNKLTKYPH